MIQCLFQFQVLLLRRGGRGFLAVWGSVRVLEFYKTHQNAPNYVET